MPSPSLSLEFAPEPYPGGNGRLRYCCLSDERGPDDSHAHRHSHLPALRGDLRAGDDARRRPDHRDPRRRDDVFSHGFICPKGPTLERAARGPRPPAHAAGPRRDGELRGGHLGRGVRRDRPAACADPRRARPRRRRPSTSATRTPTTSPRPLYGRAAAARRSARRNIFTASTVDQMPKQVSAGLMFGGDARDPGARRRPHRLPADPRRQPAGVQRQPADRARHARPAARRSASAAARSSSSTRAARRTAEAADEHHFIRPGTDALLLFGDRAHAVRRGARRPGRARRARRRARRDVRALGRAVHRPRRSRRPAASTPATIRRHRARAGRGADAPPSTGASAPARRSSARSPAGWWTSLNVAHRQPRPARRRDVPAAPPPARATRAARRAAAAACSSGAGPAACAGCREVVRRAAGRLPGRGDRHARRGPDPRADHDRRQPGAVARPTAARLRRGARRRSTSWSASTSTSTRPRATPT